MVQSPAKLITLDEFLQLPETKPASEFINGEIIQKPMPLGKHSRLQGELLNAISVLEKSKIAYALPELRCVFNRRAIVPDIAVFTCDRIPIDANGEIEDVFNAAPDWMIEILSRDQNQTKVTAKILYALKHGTQMGWLIDPAAKAILTYAPQQQPEIFENAIDSLPVPTFAQTVRLTIGEIFGWLKV